MWEDEEEPQGLFRIAKNKKEKTSPVYARELMCMRQHVIINPLTVKPACCSVLFCDTTR